MVAKNSKKSTISLIIIIAAVIAAMFVIDNIVNHNFLTVNNWMLIVAGAVIPTFTAWGLCFLFAANVTDFSIGAMVILGANLAGTLAEEMGFGIPGVIIGGLIVGICLTMVNFIVFNATKIPSWIAGMGMTLIYESIGVIYSNARLAEGKQVVQLSNEMRILGMAPLIYVILIIGGIVAYILYNKATVGINIRAVGNNEHVAKQMGIPIVKTLLCCGLIAGIFFGCSAFITESYSGRATAASGLSSISNIFQALAAVLLAQVMQKKINIIIAIPISTILIMAIFNVQTQLGVQSGTYQQVVLGAIVLIFGIIAQKGTKGVVK